MGRGQSFLFSAGSHFFETAASVFDFACQTERLFLGASARGFILGSHARQFFSALAGCFRAALSCFDFARKTNCFLPSQLARRFLLGRSLGLGFRSQFSCFLISVLPFGLFFGVLSRLFINSPTSFFNFTR